MPSSNESRDLQQEISEECSERHFDLAYEPVADVNPLELLGNCYLSMHHHMAPTDGGFDLELGDNEQP